MDNVQNLSFFQRLGGKFAIGFCVLAVLICAGSCFIGYFQYKNSLEKLYNETAYEVCHQSVSMIDGEKIKKYVNNEQTDEEYEVMKSSIENLRDKMDVVAIFAVKPDYPREGNYFYILESNAQEGKGHNFGYVENYPQRYKEEISGCYYEGLEYPDKYIYVNSADYGKNSFAMSPIYDNNNNIVSILMVQTSVDLIQKNLNKYLFYLILFTVVLVVFFLSVYLTYLRHTVIKPINMITLHTSEFVEHYTEEMPSEFYKIDLKDEIGILSRAVVKMENDIREYVADLAKAARAEEHMAAELNIAGKIQEDLFPCIFPAFPQRRDFDIYVKLLGCDVIGGNFYNYFMNDKDRIIIFAGDVSGNGVAASMFSVIAYTLISGYAAQNLSPGRILSAANSQLSKNNNAEKTVDAFLGSVNLSNGVMIYAAAGEMDVFIKHSGEGFAELPSKKGFPLASIDQAVYTNQEVCLSQGDLLCIFTKGVSNTVDEKGSMLGKDYAAEKLKELLREEYSLRMITERFFKFAEEFKGSKSQSMDSTMLLFRYFGS